MKMFLREEAVSSVESLVVDVRGAAKMLGVCERTIRNLTNRGVLSAIKLGSSVRYSREALIDFVRQGSKNESCNGNDGANIVSVSGEVAQT